MRGLSSLLNASLNILSLHSSFSLSTRRGGIRDGSGLRRRDLRFQTAHIAVFNAHGGSKPASIEYASGK
jgi:hypothetical protein